MVMFNSYVSWCSIVMLVYQRVRSEEDVNSRILSWKFWKYIHEATKIRRVMIYPTKMMSEPHLIKQKLLSLDSLKRWRKESCNCLLNPIWRCSFLNPIWRCSFGPVMSSKANGKPLMSLRFIKSQNGSKMVGNHWASPAAAWWATAPATPRFAPHAPPHPPHAPHGRPAADRSCSWRATRPPPPAPSTRLLGPDNGHPKGTGQLQKAWWSCPI